MAFWTDDKVAALQSYWARGYSAALIADFLGTTKGAVIGKADRLGLPERVLRFCKQVKPRRRGRAFQLRPCRRREKRPPAPRHSADFSWHLVQVSRGAHFRDLQPPKGAPSWRTFTRWRSGDQALQRAYEAARAARGAEIREAA